MAAPPLSAAPERWVSLETTAQGDVLRLAGHWRLSSLASIEAGLSALPAVRPLAGVDGAALASLDTAGALTLLRHLRRRGLDPAGVDYGSFADEHRRVVAVTLKRLPPAEARAPRRARNALTALGAWASELSVLLAGHLGFLGAVAAGLGASLLSPRRLRLRELAAQFRHTTLTALPVVSLVTFLIGVVFAYLLGQQAQRYGAGIFVVDGVALGIAREFSPIIVAVIVAGRSGAAFTAQLGTMRLTEETDAIRVLGLSPMDVLVLPRVLALVAGLPLLVFAGNVMGNLGAMAMTATNLGIPPPVYVERLHIALAPRHFIVGLVKAPVFALFIAVIGIRMGMSVPRDTRAIGISTTSTVVQGIVCVILLDAFFAVLFQELDI
ncbi:MAG: MlaE family ABC transporter permease [Betaproteobacteria bacterium]|nr:ABC transporter permease [Rhodocyclaceae bacterium]MCE2898602.1 ABC transporter permease [Betaproteobacteria bacterium]